MYHRVCFAAALLFAALAVPARADNSFRYLPANTKAVYVFNVSTLSEADQKQADKIVRQVYEYLAPELKDLDKIPLSDLKRVVVAQDSAGDMRGVVLLRCKVDATLLEKQMDLAEKANPDAVKIDKIGKPAVPVFSRAIEDKELQKLAPPLKKLDNLGPLLARAIRAVLPGRIYAAALDNETLMISLSGSSPVERALRKRPAKSEASITPELKKLLDGLNDKDLASVVLTEDCLAPALQTAGPKEIADWFSRFENAVARFEGGNKTVKMTLTAKCKTKTDAARFEKDTPAASKRLLDLVGKVVTEDQHKGAKGLLDLLKTLRKDDVVTITGELSEEDARRLFPVPEKK